MARQPQTFAEAEEDQPEQFAHGSKPLTGAQVGTTIDTNATITSVLYTGPPTSYELPQFDPNTGLPTSGYFCLVDTGVIPGKAVVLMNFNAHLGNHSPHPTHQIVGNSNGIPF